MNYYTTSPLLKTTHKPQEDGLKAWHLWAFIVFVWFWLSLDALTKI